MVVLQLGELNEGQTAIHHKKIVVLMLCRGTDLNILLSDLNIENGHKTWNIKCMEFDISVFL